MSVCKNLLSTSAPNEFFTVKLKPTNKLKPKIDRATLNRDHVLAFVMNIAETLENFLLQINFQNYADEHVQQMQKTLANLRVSVYGARVDRFHQLQSAQESRNFAEVSLYLRTRYCPLEKKGRENVQI